MPDATDISTPEVRFLTPICHINVDDKGEPCIELLLDGHWAPSAKLSDVFRELVELLAKPNVGHARMPDLAAEFTKNPSAYEKRVRQHVKTHAR
jgi:ubiquitin-protein ligase